MVIWREAWNRTKERLVRFRGYLHLHPRIFPAVQICGIAMSFVLLFYPPSPGIAIAILGAIAILMTLQGTMSEPQKIGWILLTTLLLIVEIFAIRRESAHNEQIRASAIKNETESFTKILQQEQTHFETVMHGFATLQQTTDDLKSVNARIHVSAPAQSSSLKTRGLLLARDMLEFVSDRIKKAPIGNAEKLTQYRTETIPLFMKKFGPRLSETRDELAAYGLKNSMLDEFLDPKLTLRTNDPENLIRQYAGKVMDFSLVVPSEKTYEHVSNERLGQMMIDEANRVETMAKLYLQREIREGAGREKVLVAHWEFTNEFKDCCFEAIKDFRGIAIKRLGPAVIDTMDYDLFEDLMEGTMNRRDALHPAMDYMPYLGQLGERLKQSKQQ
jgi:hypothetical protein